MYDWCAGPVYVESQNMVGFRMTVNGESEVVLAEDGTKFNMMYLYVHAELKIAAEPIYVY